MTITVNLIPDTGGKTFLQLCQATRQQAAIAGNGPSTVVDQTGELKRVVDWVSDAYRDIQNLHRNWEFLRADFTLNTNATTREYGIKDADVPELLSWKMDSFRIYLASVGTNDERWLRFIPWGSFRDAFLFGASRNIVQRPTHFTIKPDKTLSFWPMPPTDIYTVTGEYYQRPQVMLLDNDEPIFPVAFHDIIKWKALMDYGAYAGAPDVYANAQTHYNTKLTELEQDQLPEIGLAGAMA